jgi:hypothetical protein
MRPTKRLLHILPALLLVTACGADKGIALSAGETLAADAKPIAAEAEVESTPGAPVKLDSEQASKLGLEVRPATAAAYREEHEGFGVVWSHEAIAQVVADVATAYAAVKQSGAALARMEKLGDSPGAFPVEAIETARRQASSDEAAWQLSDRKLSALLGDHPPFKVPGADLSALASGKAKLVRVTFPLGSGPRQTPRELRLFELNSEAAAKGWKARAIWNAPADTNVPGYSFWAIASGEGLMEGERLQARAPQGAAQPGVLVPVAAVVVSDDKYWCLVEQPQGTYRRVEIDTRHPVEGGYVVSQGIATGNPLVVHGAGLLLARMMARGGGAEE